MYRCLWVDLLLRQSFAQRIVFFHFNWFRTLVELISTNVQSSLSRLPVLWLLCDMPVRFLESLEVWFRFVLHWASPYSYYSTSWSIVAQKKRYKYVGPSYSPAAGRDACCPLVWVIVSMQTGQTDRRTDRWTDGRQTVTTYIMLSDRCGQRNE